MRVDEVRDQILDAIRSGVNSGVMSTIVSAAAYRHDEVLIVMADSAEVLLRVVDVKEDPRAL